MRLAAFATLLSLALAPTAHAWGAAGHEIVATLAEIHLHPPIKAYISAKLLPGYAKGHLAPVASWADRIRMVPEFRGWSGPLHYASWEGDHPPDACSWQGQGDGAGGGWHSDHDVLNAITNYTSRLEQNPEDWVSFNFLTHFLGDVHQPMHLTSRERGGNGDPVSWEGRKTNLHSLWDGLLIARTLREQRNYTRPLPSQQIESALTGRIYDPYIRLLLWEGVREWYRSSLPEWMDCSAAGPFSSSSSASSAALAAGAQHGQLTFSSPAEGEGPAKMGDIVCPIRWATETHRVTCELAFPRGYDDHRTPPVEVGGNSEFWRGLKADHSLARLLLQGGLRLAATLNTVLAEPAKTLAEEEGWVGLLAPASPSQGVEGSQGGGWEVLVDLRWLEEALSQEE
ncbi:hypothetical protein JCM6882_001635 [Rhodosporidiobolus microsporus]